MHEIRRGGEVRQLPDQAAKYLHGERGGGGQARVRNHEVCDTEYVGFTDTNIDLQHETESLKPSDRVTKNTNNAFSYFIYRTVVSSTHRKSFNRNKNL